MAERNIKNIDIVYATGINKNTVTSLVNNKATGIQYDTLDRLCDFLNVTPGQLLKRVELVFRHNDVIEEKKGIYTITFTAKIDEVIVNSNFKVEILIEKETTTRAHYNLTATFTRKEHNKLAIIPMPALRDEIGIMTVEALGDTFFSDDKIDEIRCQIIIEND